MAGVSVADVRKLLSAGSVDPTTGQAAGSVHAVRFAERCMSAWAEAEQIALDAILEAAKGWEEETLERRVLRGANNEVKATVERKTLQRRRSWQAAAWYLEHARKERYGVKAKDNEMDDRPVKRVILESRPAHLPLEGLNGNGHSNGNGHVNGHTNGHLNGHTNGNGNGKH